MDEEGSEQSGQQDVGCVEITEIIKPVAVIWIWSMSIPSGSGSSGVFSITTSFLATKQSAFRLLMEETIPRQVNLSFHASKRNAPKAAMSHRMKQFTPFNAVSHKKKRTSAPDAASPGSVEAPVGSSEKNR